MSKATRLSSRIVALEAEVPLWGTSIEQGKLCAKPAYLFRDTETGQDIIVALPELAAIPEIKALVRATQDTISDIDSEWGDTHWGETAVNGLREAIAPFGELL